MALAIELNDVWFSYMRNTPVLRAVTLGIEERKLVAVLGGSGSGKSTLLRIIAGLRPPTKGSVWVFGRDVSTVRPQDRSTGFLFQHLALFPNLTVRENVSFGLRYRSTKSAQLNQLEELLDTLDLRAVADRLPKELSGGQAQRVALVRALASEPQLLLLDEPFSSLDRPMADAAREVFTRLHRDRGLTSVLVTHDWGQALTIADTVIVLGNDGRIIQHSNPTEAYQRPVTLEAAALTGPVNVLSGSVAGFLNGSIRVVSCGGLVQAQWASTESVPAEGAEIKIAFRPEWVSFANTSDCGLRTRVLQVVKMGQRSVVHLSVNGSILTAECGLDSCPTSGTNVTVFPNPALTLAFPASSKKELK